MVTSPNSACWQSAIPPHHFMIDILLMSAHLAGMCNLVWHLRTTGSKTNAGCGGVDSRMYLSGTVVFVLHSWVCHVLALRVQSNNVRMSM